MNLRAAVLPGRGQAVHLPSQFLELLLQERILLQEGAILCGQVAALFMSFVGTELAKTTPIDGFGDLSQVFMAELSTEVRSAAHLAELGILSPELMGRETSRFQAALKCTLSQS